MNTEIESRLKTLEERNIRVEADKTWETSFERRLAIVVLTYIVVALFLSYSGTPNPWRNALVPSVGFLLSTLTLGWLKSLWLSRSSSK